MSDPMEIDLTGDGASTAAGGDPSAAAQTISSGSSSSSNAGQSDPGADDWPALTGTIHLDDSLRPIRIEDHPPRPTEDELAVKLRELRQRMFEMETDRLDDPDWNPTLEIPMNETPEWKARLEGVPPGRQYSDAYTVLQLDRLRRIAAGGFQGPKPVLGQIKGPQPGAESRVFSRGVTAVPMGAGVGVPMLENPLDLGSEMVTEKVPDPKKRGKTIDQEVQIWVGEEPPQQKPDGAKAQPAQEVGPGISAKWDPIIFVMRHAKGQHQGKGNEIFDVPDAKLKVAGEEQCLNLRDKIPNVAHIFSSPMKRCLDTALLTTISEVDPDNGEDYKKAEKIPPGEPGQPKKITALAELQEYGGRLCNIGTDADVLAREPRYENRVDFSEVPAYWTDKEDEDSPWHKSKAEPRARAARRRIRDMASGWDEKLGKSFKGNILVVTHSYFADNYLVPVPDGDSGFQNAEVRAYQFVDLYGDDEDADLQEMSTNDWKRIKPKRR